MRPKEALGSICVHFVAMNSGAVNSNSRISYVLSLGFTFSQPVQAKSSSYWLYGTGDYAGGNSSIVYNKGKFKMKGKVVKVIQSA